MTNEEIAAELVAIINSPDPKLDAEMRRDCLRYVEVHERGVALTKIEDWIVDHDVEIGAVFFARLLALRVHFGGTRKSEEYIRERLLR